MTTSQGHCRARDCIDMHSHMGFPAVFAWVLPRLESEASLPLQTGRRRRVILKFISPGRRKGQGTRTPSRKRVLALGADLLHPPLVLGCFLSSARIWMRPGLYSKIYWGGLFQTTFLPHRNPAPEERFGRQPQTMSPGLHSWRMVDESFSILTREKPVSNALKVSSQCRERI